MVNKISVVSDKNLLVPYDKKVIPSKEGLWSLNKK